MLLLGLGCSGSDAVIIAAGGGFSSENRDAAADPSLDVAPGGARGAPGQAKPSSGASSPASSTSPEGIGGSAPLEPAAASGSGGSPSVPSMASSPPTMPEAPTTPAASDPAAPDGAASDPDTSDPNTSDPNTSDPSPPDPPALPPAPLDPGERSCEPQEGTLSGLRLTQLVDGLAEPIYVTAAPDDDTRLFVLEKGGVIRVVRDGRLLAEPFLDLREVVATDDEQGLVGLAFHPRYSENGRFFIQYAWLDPARLPGQDQRVVLSEFARSPEDPDRADAASERTLMVIEQPATIHLGGMLAFGPADGMLYIGRGDGGAIGPRDLDTLTGKMLRIDVDAPSEERPYGIPEGNLTGAGVLPEIWSRGLRNPWRFSFDVCTGDMYIGDVGESSFEEIDFEPANTPGRNYGWKTLEGPRCFDGTSNCDTSGLSEPVLVYEHDSGCAVISGYVYRGERIAPLRGTYLYADYCSGYFGSFRIEEGRAVDVRDITLDINPGNVRQITSFGMDNAGELYVVTQRGGLYRIDPD